MPVLVVDDDPAIRRTVAEALDMEGYEVLEAQDGAEALDLLADADPCVVLLDMRMPVLDGWGFAAELRRRELRVPIVVMTAASNAQRWCAEIGGDDCLAKPFMLDDLYRVVGAFCGAAPSAA